jgi:hypothetical protein
MSNQDLFLALGSGDVQDVESSLGITLLNSELGAMKEDVVPGRIGGVGIYFMRSRRAPFDPYPNKWNLIVMFSSTDKWEGVRLALAFKLYSDMWQKSQFSGEYLCWLADGKTLFHSSGKDLYLNEKRRNYLTQLVRRNTQVAPIHWNELPEVG